MIKLGRELRELPDATGLVPVVKEIAEAVPRSTPRLPQRLDTNLIVLGNRNTSRTVSDLYDFGCGKRPAA